MATVNISLPKSMYEDAKKMLVKKRYASVSELMRDALRRILYEDITENGFTSEFEEEVLKAAANPKENDNTLETEEEIDTYFSDLHIKLERKRHDKN